MSHPTRPERATVLGGRTRLVATVLLIGGLVTVSANPSFAAGEPDPPTIDSVTGGLTTIQVSFTPGADNGSPITQFTVSCTSSDGGTSGAQTGVTSPITVSELTTGKTYTCTATATNAAGTSADSAASSAVVPSAAPAAPIGVRAAPLATNVGTGSLRVSFANGGSNGSAVTSYTATCTSLNGGVTGSASGAGSPISVGALTSAKRYGCTVTATNARGTGAASAPATATVGAPAAPTVLRLISLPQGLAVVVRRNADNGAAVISYRARCISPNGGAPQSPLQLASPIIASGLTPGATYSCSVTANNLRGESPPTASPPIVVGTAFATTSCSGSSGTITLDPGLRLVVGKPQTLNLESSLPACSGGYASAARIKFSMRSVAPMSCQNATSATMRSGGWGRITWLNPSGMGTSGASVRLIFSSTSGDTVTAHFYGEVTQRRNLFTDRRISGRMTLGTGFAPVASGGGCRVEQAIKSLSVESIRFSLK